MFKRIGVMALASTILMVAGHAESKKKIVIPIEKVSPADGKMMYGSYCAPCHGIDGKGNGPAASALKAAPTDLTKMTQMNKGKFPDTHVVAVLRFGTDIPAHGSATMPVWGPILANMSHINTVERDLRVSNLTRYLESIQEK